MLCKLKAVQKKASGTKKRKRGNDKTDKVEERCYLPPYSPFLNPVELFWSKIKGNIRKNCLSVDNSLSLRITEAAKKATQEDCANWISHSQPFFDRCLTLEPML
ncbi:hypothetical protein BCV72DRAFT_249876 [Rhizopus microsporus var. microsporus]|uniref:Tc1-like transposase DDE domain-containing protein n=1 Tax=Rhizopus microsporus var. microsporus TaxID=86635 RepID=A0A1X0R3W5_RHIZD|nr:hypothetical protein BCV72DRAFT_249876 [Rhizopus microsporus var. microsporus]